MEQLSDLVILNNNDLMKAKDGIRKIKNDMKFLDKDSFKYNDLCFMKIRLNNMIKDFKTLKQKRFKVDSIIKYASCYDLNSLQVENLLKN